MSTMMTQDQNKKTLRHFQCRDYLWEIFEQMSAELECSTDYLINEAMRQYARSRNYGTSRRAAEAPISTQPPPPHMQAPSSSAIPSLRENVPQRALAPTPPPRPSRTSMPAAAPRLPSSMPPPPRPGPPPPSRPMSMPPPLPAPGRAANAHGAGRPQLYVIF